MPPVSSAWSTPGTSVGQATTGLERNQQTIANAWGNNDTNQLPNHGS